jgi:ketosteroid isomerase-like protein
LNPAQTIEEIDAHRQKEVLALVPYLDAALRRDVQSVAAALVADLEENAAEERHKEKMKELEELQAQILSEFDALSDDLATTEKTSWYTETPVVDGTHGAGRCGGVRRAPADAGCPCAGSTRTPTTSRPFAMSSTSSTLGSCDSSRCSCFALALYSCARHLHRG